MKIALIGALGLLWFCLPSSNAQRSTIGVAPGATPPPICSQVDSLNELAFQSMDPVQIEQFARQALNLVQTANCPKSHADCYFRLGLAKAEMGELHKAKMYYKHGLILRKKLGDSLDIAKGYKNLGQLYARLNQYDSAQYCFRQALEFIQSRKELALAKLYNELGSLYSFTNDFETARIYYHRGMLLYPQLVPNKIEKLEEIQLERATTRMNYAALIQDHFNQKQAAKDSLLRSLRDFKRLDAQKYIPLCHLLLGNNAYYQRDLPLAETYFLKSISDSLLLNPLDRARTYKNFGRVYLDQGKYPQARRNLKLSRKILVPLNNDVELALLQFEWANFFYEQAGFADAARNYLKVLRLQPKDTLLVGRTLFFLSDAYQELKLPKQAKRYEDQLIRLLNNLNSDQGNEAFQELFRYQMDKQSLLKQFLQTKNDLLVQRSLLIGSTLAGLLLLALGAYYWNRQRLLVAEQLAKIAEQKTKIAEQNEQIAVQEKLDLLKNREIETHYALLEGQDIMQKQIGRELHEGVGTLLSTVKLNLAPVDEVLDLLPKNHQAQYTKANQLLDEACAEIRRISHELGSALLSKLGLKAQLEALAEVIPGSGKLQVEMTTFGLHERLPYKTELNIYRIVQELVNNTIKHAQASKISIQVNRFTDVVNILVEDNGKGFDLNEVAQKRTAGITNLEARTHELDGTFLLDTKLGRGTIVSIDFPILIPNNEKD